jgi:murein DD-endopeptidase MepM/ murein hydrolase activator NlpD
LSEALKDAPASPLVTSSTKGSSSGIPRLATHGWVLAVAVFVGAMAPLGLRQPVADVQATHETSRTQFRTSLNELQPPVTAAQDNQLPAPTHYRVRPGDSVDSIASQAGISVDTLVKVNQLTDPAHLLNGQPLVVPPIDGSMVKVDPNESLASLASDLGLDTAELRAVNGLGLDATLPRELFVPASTGKRRGQLKDRPDSNGGRHHLVRFGWPTQGIITQRFSPFHLGLDIANQYGTPEVAADSGRVVFAGWGSYGIYVEIDHGNGFRTIYGHMSAVLVTAGQTVVKGDRIGLMGATGIATGDHLHFEIRFQGAPQNPLDLLS